MAAEGSWRESVVPSRPCSAACSDGKRNREPSDGKHLNRSFTMRKSIALLLTLVLSATASDVRAQFGPPYHPLTGRPINRGVNNRGNIYGPRMPQGRGVPGPNDRYN